MKRLHCLVSGEVQGVYFRGATQKRMRELGVRGWVRNLPDGRVEALIEGDDSAVEQGVEFLRNGPRGARVTGVELRGDATRDSLVAFEIRR